MKRFLLYIILFFLPVFGFIAYIFNIEVPRYFAYFSTKNEGCPITWIYERIYSHEQNIDVAFIGTSHTGCGINDRLIDSLNSGTSYANLAYCQGGRSIQYTVLKDLLERHKLKMLVLEVTMEEDFTSHRDFGIVGRTEDVVHAPFIGNSRYFSDLFKAFQVHYMYFQDSLLNKLPKVRRSPYISPYSHYEYFTNEENISKLENHRDTELKKVQKFSEGTYRNYKLRYPMTYIDKIKALSVAYGFELVFVYIPSYGMASEEPFNRRLYEERGRLFIPKPEIFRTPKFWMDSEHFNREGATLLSTWLAAELHE